MTAPCAWNIPTPPTCCDCWNQGSPVQQEQALDYATTILWASTGRQFGLCPVTVRPCGAKPCGSSMWNFWGTQVGAGWMSPYNFNGQWFNACGCTPCSCDPRAQVRLMGPVDSITEVRVGGVAVPATSYRVDDRHWLVRTDGLLWPQCPDMDADIGPDVFEVAYNRGTPVPPALLNAAGTLACETLKACIGVECRLSNRVQSMVRNGISIELQDPQALLDDGYTGLPEVDALIRAYNPYGLKQRLRIYAPELMVARTVTSA